MPNYYAAYYSHYFDESRKVTVVYFTVEKLDDDKKEVDHLNKIVLKAFVKLHGAINEYIYFIIKHDEIWKIYILDANQNLMFLENHDRLTEFIKEVVVTEYEKNNNDGKSVEGANDGFVPERGA